MATLSLFLLGPPRLELAGEPLEIKRRKALALLIYLAVSGDRQLRDSLATLLWPESSQQNARKELRRNLSVLNQALGGNWLDIDRESVGLRAGFGLDVAQFQQYLADETVDPPTLIAVTDLYRDDFLTGFTLPDCPEFDEWQFFQSESLRQILASALERLVGILSDQTDYEPAIPYARRWLALDPLHEPAHRQLMLLYAQAGQQAAALRQYALCRQTLEDELGISPTPETTALYEQIRARKVGPAESAATSGSEKATPVQAVAGGLREVAEPSHALGGVGRGGRTRQTEPAVSPVQPPAFLNTEAELIEFDRPVLVDREGELAQLDSFLKNALSGRGQLVFVTGEAGQGKTSLVNEFVRQAQATHAGLIVANGYCNAYAGLGDPYLPFRDVMEMLTGAVEAKWAAGAITREHALRLWRLLPITVQDLLDAGPDLIDIFVPGTALVERATTAVPSGATWLAQLKELTTPKPTGSTNLEQSYLFEQYARVLHSLAAQRPLLITLDDLQWADTASISLLFHLGRRIGGSQILIVGAYRPEDVAQGRDGEQHPLQDILSEFKRRFGDVWISLNQAVSSRGRAFIDAFLDTEPNLLDENFRQELTRRTGGHPLFTVELLRDLQERGDLLRGEQSRWTAQPNLQWEMFPTRVQGVIERRIGRLDSELREVLTVASVEGEEFTAEVIARVQGLSQRQLLRHLSQELEQRHRLVREGEEVKAGRQLLWRYQFAHILFQRYLYDSLSAGERRLLHAEIGQALEAIYEGHTDKIAVQLVHHFREAGRRIKAIEYARQAAQQAKAAYAYDEASQHLQTALNLLEAGEQVETRLALLEELADVHGLRGLRGLLRHDVQVVSLYQAALEQWSSLAGADKLIAIRLHRKILQRAWAMVEYPEQFEATAEARAAAQDYLESSLILTEAELPQRERVRVLTALAKIGYGLRLPSALDTAEHYAQAAVDLAEQLDAPEELSEALEALADVYFEYGRLPAYQAVSRRRLTLSRDPRFGDVRKQIGILRDLSDAMMPVGEYAQGIAYLTEAESLAAQHPALVPPLETLGRQALFWLRLDRWDELFQVDKRRQDFEQRYSLDQFEGGYCMELAVAAAGLALRGDFDQARVLREQAYDYMVQFGGTENWGRTEYY